MLIQVINCLLTQHYRLFSTLWSFILNFGMFAYALLFVWHQNKHCAETSLMKIRMSSKLAYELSYIISWLIYCKQWIAGEICINDCWCRVPESRVWESNRGSGCHPFRAENLILYFVNSALKYLIIHASFWTVYRHGDQLWPVILLELEMSWVW